MKASGSAEVAQDERSTPLPFGVGLGQRLRQVREESGETATTVSERCQRLGLSWDRTILSRVERGHRSVAVGELMVLALVYHRPLADLLPQQTVALTDGPPATTATPGALREWLTEAPSSGWHVDGLIERALDALPALFTRIDGQIANEVPGAPGGAVEVMQAATHATDEATSKASKALGATPLQVALAAQVLWKHGLAEERDARAVTLGPSPSMRARQARRGHITRRLLDELRPVVEQVRVAKTDENDDARG